MSVRTFAILGNYKNRRNFKIKMKLKNTLMCIGVVSLMGCATMKQSLLLGVATGATTGALINHSVDRDNPSAATNGAIGGAVVGLAASYFIHDGLESRDAKVRRETLLNLDKFNVSHPPVDSGASDDDYYVTSPKVETQCFDSDVRGNKLIEAHCESVIVDRPEWAKRMKKAKKSE